MEEQLHFFLYCHNFFFFFFLKDEPRSPHDALAPDLRMLQAQEGPAPWDFGAEMAGIQQAGSVGGQENTLGEWLWDS